MNWSSHGSPTQLEVNQDGQMKLYTKAADIARTMNEFFVMKVQNILHLLKSTPLDLAGCRKVVEGKKDLSLSMQFVSVQVVKSMLKKLKNKRSTSIDNLDNYAVKLAADYIAEPLHHVISPSIMQQKSP